MINTSTLVPTGASRIPNWVSGGSYVIGDQVVSVVTLKEYIRRTNGGGVTDPSADATNWSLLRSSSTQSISSSFSTAGYTPLAISSSVNAGAVAAASGALTANVLSTALNITGTAGIVSQFTVRTVDATARTIRIVLTVDGNVRYDITSASVAVTGRGACLAGNVDPTFSTTLPPIEFTSSCKIEIASSLTETGKFTIESIHQTRV